MDDTNTAAAEAQATTEATPTNQTEQATQPEAQKNTITLTDEQAKFFESNGGIDKMFDKIKNAISNPESTKAPEPAPTEPAKTADPTPQVQQPQPAQKPQGITMQELFAKQYFNGLASEEGYANIADDIRSGEVLNGMKELGINPYYEDGSINDGLVRNYLNLRAKTVPATTTSTPAATTTPTVDYVDVGETITSKDQAMSIINQTAQLRASGQADHPRYNEAFDFILGKKPAAK